MGSLGFSEMLVIFIVALLIFGPKKLPELGKSLGKGIKEFKKATDELKSSWEDQVKDIKAPLDDVKKDFHEMGRDLKSDFYKSIEAEHPVEPPAEPPVEHVHAANVPTETHDTHETPRPAESTVPKEHA